MYLCVEFVYLGTLYKVVKVVYQIKWCLCALVVNTCTVYSVQCTYGMEVWKCIYACKNTRNSGFFYHLGQFLDSKLERGIGSKSGLAVLEFPENM